MKNTLFQNIIRLVHKSTRILSLVFVVGFLVIVSSVYAQNAPAGSSAGSVGSVNSSNSNAWATAYPTDLHGWLWSDMPDGSDQTINPSNQFGGRGLGYISLNGSDSGFFGNYRVTLDSSGNFTGYGWSEFGGWLDFNPAGPTPDGSASGAHISSSCLSSAPATFPTCPVTGWIRFTTYSSTFAGGWDGWVKMGDINSHSFASYGVVYHKPQLGQTIGTFSGDAWGDQVAGWINFDNARVAIITNPVPNTCTNPSATNYGGSNPCMMVCYDTAGNSYPYAAGTPLPVQCNSITPPLTCDPVTDPTCVPSGPPPVVGLPGASITLNQTHDCTTGTATISWTSVGISPNTCQAITNGTTGISGFSGTVSANGSASVTGILANGQPNNFTITCGTVASGYTHRGPVTNTTSVMCPIPACDPAVSTCPSNPGGIPRPHYKEN
jgi:hypothetical protein